MDGAGERWAARMHRIVPAVLVFVVACGDDGSAQPTTDDGGTSGPGSSSSDESPSDEDGSESAGGNTTDSSTTAPADTSTGIVDDSGSESGGEPIVCEIGETRLVGDLDGMAIDEMPFGSGAFARTIGPTLEFGDLGRIHLRAVVEGVEAPEPIAGPGYLRMASDGPLADEWYCFDDTSTYSTGAKGSYMASLNGAYGLGACPGDDVVGTASICFGDASCGGERTFTTDVEGATFTTSLGELGEVGGKIGATDMDVENDLGDVDGGIVYLHATTVDFGSKGPQQSPVDAVYFIVPLGEEDGGAIYCAQGSTLDYEIVGGIPEPLSAEVTDISRLGTCERRSGSDHIDYCMNFGL
jgi:hypothetical protein